MKLPPQFFKDWSRGQINNVNRNVVPQNSADLALNLDADEEIGALVSRLGTAIVGAQLVSGKTILGLHNFRDTVGTNHKLLAAINASNGATSVVYQVEAGTTIVTGLTASAKMRFKTFLDSVVMINGSDVVRSYDGASVITTGGAFDLGNWPASKITSLVEVFLDRVYTAGDSANPDRLYYSGVATAGAISWTAGNGFIDVELSNGAGGITALGKAPGYLLIFKERSLHRFDYNSAYPESLVSIGTPSQESVVSAGGLCAFFSASSKEARGFYITDGGRPQPISHDRTINIKKWVDAIPQSYEASVSGFATERFFGWSIGDVTVDGRAYTNVVVRYNKFLDQWSVRSYPSEFHAFCPFVASGINKIVGGDDNGQVIELDAATTYTDYNAQPINWEFLSQREDFSYNQIKNIAERVVIKTENAIGAEVYALTGAVKDQKNTGLGRINRDIVDEIKLKKSLTTNEFQLGIRGTVQGARAYLREVELPNVEVTEAYV